MLGKIKAARRYPMCCLVNVFFFFFGLWGKISFKGQLRVSLMYIGNDVEQLYCLAMKS